MRTRQLAIPTGIAVAVITAVAPATVAQAHTQTAAGSSFSAARHGHGHGHGHWRGFDGVRGEVQSYNADSGRLVIETRGDDTVTGTVTRRTKLWMYDGGETRKSSFSAASIRAMCGDDRDDDATRAEVLAALDPGADVKAVFSRSGKLKAVAVEK